MMTPPRLLCGLSYSYMIDNVILLITGTLHQRAISELVPKCHPLGSFEQMEAVNIAQTPAELYNAILVDTPLGVYRHVNCCFNTTGCVRCAAVPLAEQKVAAETHSAVLFVGLIGIFSVFQLLSSRTAYQNRTWMR